MNFAPSNFGALLFVDATNRFDLRIRLGSELPRHQFKLPPIIFGQDAGVTRQSPTSDGRKPVADGGETEQDFAQVHFLDTAQTEG
jgi:hypothetical protein